MNPREKIHSIKELQLEIESSQKSEYPILKSHLMEAMSILNMRPATEDEMFYYLCAINLINAWISRQRKMNQNRQKDKELRSIYSFKERLGEELEQQLAEGQLLAKMHIESNLVMLESKGYQFSFHAVKIGKHILEYSRSHLNEPINWCGKRLQPIAPLLFELGKLKCPHGLTNTLTFGLG